MVYLKTNGAKTSKHIGTIQNIGGKPIYFKTHRFLNVIKKLDSIGVCYEVIKYLGPNGAVALRNPVTGETVYANVSEALQKGKFLHYKSKGYEKQLIIPLEIFKETVGPNMESGNKGASTAGTGRPV
jgi:hypothetical protein